MSLETKHFLNGEEIRPINADSIGFKFNWTEDVNEGELNVDSIKLSNRAKCIVLEFIDQYGIFQGIPYDVTIGTVTIQYYVDLTDSPLLSGNGDEYIEVKIKRRQAVDLLKQRADGTTFDLINKSNPINTFNVPYIIVKDNQLELYISLIIATYSLSKALQEAVRDLSDAITEVIRATTPNVGIPPSIDLGDVISATILAIARALYIVILLVALVKMVKEIIELIFPLEKNFRASTVLELMTKGFAYLGYKFTTSVSEFSNITILSKPILCPREGVFKQLFSFDTGLRTSGFPNGLSGDSITTLGQMADFCKTFCNGKMRVQGDTVSINRRDFNNSNSGVTINRTLNVQSRRESQYTINTGEAWKRYFIKLQLDTMDVHTYDNIQGVYAEHSTEPVNVLNDDLILNKGLVSINLPFSLGSRKNELNFIEKLFIPFAKLGDQVINLFGGNGNNVSKIKGRVGLLQISQQYFSQTKILYTVGGKQPFNFLDFIGAEAIYRKYHSINQVKENCKRIETGTVALSTEAFECILKNNFVTDQDGNELELLTFEYINESKEALIQYAYPSNEGDNTKTITIEGGAIFTGDPTLIQC